MPPPWSAWSCSGGETGAHLAGIFCGHVHFSHAGAFRENCLQYVTNPGFAGGYRIIELKRLPG